MDNKLIPYDDLQFIGRIIDRSRWIFAKTMPQNPHYYMLRKETRDADFVRFVELIRKYGYRNKYGGYWYTQLNVDNWFYWTMGAKIDDTILINRKERRLGIESPYDNVGVCYTDFFEVEDGNDEDIQIADFISRHNISGRTLEIGCGVGSVTKNLRVNRNGYIGIDPSHKMLEMFKENTILSGLNVLHTDFESYCPRGKFDFVFATYGAASYVRPEFWVRLNDILERGGSFMLMYYADNYTPVTHLFSNTLIQYESASSFPKSIQADIRVTNISNYVVVEGVKK